MRSVRPTLLGNRWVNAPLQQYGDSFMCGSREGYITPVTNITESTLTRVEAGSNTSTVTLRVVGGDEKESLKSETLKYGLGSVGTRTQGKLLWQGPATYTKDRPVLSSERTLHKNKTVSVKQ
jgi:hypothetical protein